jgi:hypothetical protein
MNYETVVADLWQRFPRFQDVYSTEFAFMGEEAPGAYLVFGSVLIPALEHALAVGDLGQILPICAFLEDVAVAARKDGRLESLLQVEVGEWLGGTATEASLAPWLGTETKRICRYVPGLATQRIALQEEHERQSIKNRISTFMTRLRRT